MHTLAWSKVITRKMTSYQWVRKLCVNLRKLNKFICFHLWMVATNWRNIVGKFAKKISSQVRFTRCFWTMLSLTFAYFIRFIHFHCEIRSRINCTIVHRTLRHIYNVLIKWKLFQRYLWEDGSAKKGKNISLHSFHSICSLSPSVPRKMKKRSG